MIAVEIPSALAADPQVVPADAPEPCPECSCYPSQIDPDIRGRCPYCDDKGDGFDLLTLVGQRVALAWRETCPTCLRLGMWPCEACSDNGSRMVVGWTAEVKAIVPIVSTATTPHPITEPHVCAQKDGAPVAKWAGAPGLNRHADWSPGRYALVLQNVMAYIVKPRLFGQPIPVAPCRPFTGFAQLDDVLSEVAGTAEPQVGGA